VRCDCGEHEQGHDWPPGHSIRGCAAKQAERIAALEHLARALTFQINWVNFPSKEKSYLSDELHRLGIWNNEPKP
jgi:hypothetical protein